VVTLSWEDLHLHQTRLIAVSPALATHMNIVAPETG
jgi:hypothetical protein